jgi:phenylalanyl-tRNA synthetase beta subunit
MIFKLGVDLVKCCTLRYKIEADTIIKSSYTAEIQIWVLNFSEKKIKNFEPDIPPKRQDIGIWIKNCLLFQQIH